MSSRLRAYEFIAFSGTYVNAYGQLTKVGAGASGTFDPTEYAYNSTTGLMTKVRYWTGANDYDANRRHLCPSGAQEEKPVFTGCAAFACQRTSLHPWLQSDAPPGRRCVRRYGATPLRECHGRCTIEQVSAAWGGGGLGGVVTDGE